jgi:AcrR family transcriptional regulator
VYTVDVAERKGDGQSRKEQVVRAALEIADEQGLDAVTMRAVGDRLGVTPMALYRHVADKQALLDEVLDLAMSQVEQPDPGLGWTERLVALSAALRAMAARHPTVIPLTFSRPGSTPAVRALVGVVYGALADAGVPERDRPRLERMLSTFVVGFAISEVSGRFPTEHADGLSKEFATDLEALVGLIRAAATPSS